MNGCPHLNIGLAKLNGGHKLTDLFNRPVGALVLRCRFLTATRHFDRPLRWGRRAVVVLHLKPPFQSMLGPLLLLLLLLLQNELLLFVLADKSDEGLSLF